MNKYRVSAPEAITIVLPYPDPKLNAHPKGRWNGKRSAVKRARGDAKLLALKALDGRPAPRWTRARLTMDMWFPKNSGQDVLNFAQMCKAGIDGIVDAGIITNDNHTVLPDPHPRFAGYDKADPRIEITITPAQEPSHE